MFKPSRNLPPVILGADPTAYHLQGKQLEKGNRGRTMSRGELQRFAECPRKWLRSRPDDVTSAMEWGSLVDTLALTPSLFDRVYAIAPTEYETTGMQCPNCKSVTDSSKCAKCRTDRVQVTVKQPWSWNSTTCQQWRDEQEQAGKTVVKQSLVSEARQAVNRLGEDEEITAILQCCDKQVQVNVDWHDEGTGVVVPFKCLLDLVPKPESPYGDTAFDFKTTDSADDRKWQRTVFSFKLYYQGALYLDALNAATGLKYRRFGNVIQESSHPFEPAHRLLSEEFLNMGRNEYTGDIKRYCWCLSRNEWPGYSNAIAEPEVWMMK